MAAQFTIEDDKGLDRIKTATQRQSRAEVVRDALSLYEHLLLRRTAGEKLFVGPNRKDAAEFCVTTFEQAVSSGQANSAEEVDQEDQKGAQDEEAPER